MPTHRLLMSASAAALTFGLTGAFAADTVPGFVTASLANYGRPQADLYRDKALKPGEVMSFAGIKPGMAVAEIMPENGYWTRIISGIVGPKGNAYMFVMMPRGSKPEKDANQNEAYTRVVNANAVDYQPEYDANISVYWDSLNSFPQHFNLPKQLDAVVMAGDYATIKAEQPKLDMVEGNKSIFRAMKNGGVYVIIGAQANKGAGFTQAALGRAEADAIKAEVTAAGFVLDGESTALTHTEDAHGTAANDNSDMYVLRFKKPINAPSTDKRPASPKDGMNTQLDATRGSNPGLIRRADTGPDRERHVLYHGDWTYQEWGQRGSGNNPWQSGTWFFNADGGSCMQHLFPTDQQGFVNCNYNMPPKDLKPGDLWMESGSVYRDIGPGKQQFKDEDANEGGTLGDTPEEKARNFGKVLAFGEKNGAEQTYTNQFIIAYYHFREESKGDAAALDREFQSTYGKPVPARPAPPAKRD